MFSNLNREKTELEETYNCLFEGKYQKESDNDITKSINHDMYLQKVRKNTLSAFVEKRCYLNQVENVAWNRFSMLLLSDTIMCTCQQS